MKGMLVALAAVEAVALAGAAAADQTFNDSTGEKSGSADISSVAVTNDAAGGTISFAVATNMPTLEDMSSWIAFVAPAGTPRPIIDKIQAEVVKIYADPAVADRMEKAGLNPVSSTPEEFDAFFRSEAARWEKAFRESGIKLD